MEHLLDGLLNLQIRGPMPRRVAKYSEGPLKHPLEAHLVHRIHAADKRALLRECLAHERDAVIARGEVAEPSNGVLELDESISDRTVDIATPKRLLYPRGTKAWVQVDAQLRNCLHSSMTYPWVSSQVQA